MNKIKLFALFLMTAVFITTASAQMENLGSSGAMKLSLENLSDDGDMYPKGLSATFSLESRNTFLLGHKDQVLENYSPLDANTFNVGIFRASLLVGGRYGLLLNARIDNAGQNPEMTEELQGYIGLGGTFFIIKDAFRIDAFAGPTFKKSEYDGRSTRFFGGMAFWFGGYKLPSIEGSGEIVFNNDGCKYVYTKFTYELNEYLNLGFVTEKNMGRNLRIGPVLETKVIATDYLNFKITGGVTAGSEEVWNAHFGIKMNIKTR